MTRFRPCIDLHHGCVKQIVGSTLSDDESRLHTRFIADRPASWYAGLYRRDGLRGGHVIQLGKGNEEAALSALQAYPGGMQIGGGITPGNAQQWLQAGASHVIVTSYLFHADGRFDEMRLAELAERVGKQHLVIDLSCRRTAQGWTVAMNRWQTLTDLEITPATLAKLASRCDEFLVHAADVEGKCHGIDRELVRLLGAWRGCPVTYAGGISSMEDLERIDTLSQGHLDATVGSALDLFGGTGIRYADLIARQKR